MSSPILHLDCFSGASGNMLLGALIDLGVPPDAVREPLARLGIAGLELRTRSVKRGAIAGIYVSFSGPERSGVERRWASIRALLKEAELAPRVRENALEAFSLLAEAEARVHGVAADDVHFHEVGAVDAIGDIVGVAIAIEHLGVKRITSSPLALGSGQVDTAHGRLPLPAPATMELLRGIPTYPAHVEWETVTPTGAALIRVLAGEFGPLPAMAPSGQGFGAGEEREGPVPNLLRALLGSPVPALEADTVTVIETNLDDMNPEHLPYLLEELLADGALDASLSPLSMKKGRPGQLLRVIALPQDRERLVRRILTESSSIGVRYQEMSRLKLPREMRVVSTSFGPVPVKRTRTPDGRTLTTPEYEACSRLAREHGVPLKRIYQAAERAAEEEPD